MATHSRILAWEIPWKEEPGRLQSGVAKELAVIAHMHTKANVPASCRSWKGRIGQCHFLLLVSFAVTKLSLQETSGKQNIGLARKFIWVWPTQYNTLKGYNEKLTSLTDA